MVSTAMKPEHD